MIKIQWKCASSAVLFVAAIQVFFSGNASAAEIVGIGGTCLDVTQSNAADGTPIIIWPCHGGKNQQWKLEDGQIVGLAEKCLDVAQGDTADGAKIILWRCHGGRNQRWTIYGGRIIGIGVKCLDVTRGDTTGGTPVILWHCHGGPNQNWRIRSERQRLSPHLTSPQGVRMSARPSALRT